MTRKAIIICGFAGIGKTSIKDVVPNFRTTQMYDLKSHMFVKEKGWEKTYVDCALALADKYDFVFLSTHDVVISELAQRGENFTVVYPYKHCKDEYMDRFRRRGNNEQYIQQFRLRWDRFISQLDTCPAPYKICLRSGQYLSDVVLRLIFNR